MAIKENRLLTINYKVFNLSDLRRLVNVLWTEYNEVNRYPKEPSIQFYIKCFDHSSFTSDDIAIFNDDSIIAQRRVKNIKVEFSLEDKRTAIIFLEHGYTKTDDGFISNSDIEIGGTDRAWVNNIVTKFQDVLNSIPDQQTLIRKYYYLFASVAIIATFAACLIIADWMHSHEKNYIPAFSRLVQGKVTNGSIIAGIFISLICGLVLYTSIRDYSEELFPTIELQIGPSHTFSEVTKRKRLYTYYSLIIGPILWILVKHFLF